MAPQQCADVPLSYYALTQSCWKSRCVVTPSSALLSDLVVSDAHFYISLWASVCFQLIRMACLLWLLKRLCCSCIKRVLHKYLSDSLALTRTTRLLNTLPANRQHWFNSYQSRDIFSGNATAKAFNCTVKYLKEAGSVLVMLCRIWLTLCCCFGAPTCRGRRGGSAFLSPLILLEQCSMFDQNRRTDILKALDWCFLDLKKDCLQLLTSLY